MKTSKIISNTNWTPCREWTEGNQRRTSRQQRPREVETLFAPLKSLFIRWLRSEEGTVLIGYLDVGDSCPLLWIQIDAKEISIKEVFSKLNQIIVKQSIWTLYIKEALPLPQHLHISFIPLAKEKEIRGDPFGQSARGGWKVTPHTWQWRRKVGQAANRKLASLLQNVK